MSPSELEFKPIRNTFIAGLLAICIPALMVSIVGEENLDFPETSPSIYALQLIFSLVAFISIFYGYFACWSASIKYAEYKGYHWIVGFIAGFFNVLGISFLFLLDNKRQIETNNLKDNDFNTFNLWSILLAYLAIGSFFYPIIIVGIALGGGIGINSASNLLDDTNISYLRNRVLDLIIFWYFYKIFTASKINFKWLLGWSKKVNIFVALSLAIAQYFFSWGLNSFTLYGISFIYPKYLNYLINQDQASTIYGFAGLFIGAVIFAPIWEEIVCRGIIFQKVASTKSIFWGIMMSSFIFTIIHFRYDVIPLFIFGVITALLYTNTKQLVTPILLHFFFNLIIVGRQIYYHYFVTASDVNTYSNVAEYQEYFLNHLNSRILFIAFSAPYLIYFIYKNFPRHNDINKLPYYANKARATEN